LPRKDRKTNARPIFGRISGFVGFLAALVGVLGSVKDLLFPPVPTQVIGTIPYTVTTTIYNTGTATCTVTGCTAVVFPPTRTATISTNTATTSLVYPPQSVFPLWPILLIIGILLVLVWSRQRVKALGTPQQTTPLYTFCPNCGAENPTSNQFCMKCGNRLKTS